MGILLNSYYCFVQFTRYFVMVIMQLLKHLQLMQFSCFAFAPQFTASAFSNSFNQIRILAIILLFYYGITRS